jgi:uncharacterized protein YndB with AHSA1/START domain
MNKTNLTAEPGKHNIEVTNIIDAPRDLVFKIYTNPEMIPQWWGPRGLTTRVDRMELRPGGIWRFVQQDADGKEYAFHGVYHEVAQPARVVTTFEFEGMPGHVLLETIAFDEMNGMTKITDSSIFQSVEDRDGMLKQGMEEGSSESMDRFTELLHKVSEGVKR